MLFINFFLFEASPIALETAKLNLDYCWRELHCFSKPLSINL